MRSTPTRGATVVTQALRRRQPAKPGRVRPGHHHAGVEARRSPSAPALDHWRNYDAHFLESSVATGLPTANNKPSCTTSGGVRRLPAGPQRHGRQPSRRGAVSPDRRVSVWGDFGLRVPRPDAQRAVSPVFASARSSPGRTINSAPSGWSAASSASTSLRRRNVTVRTHLVRQPRQESGVQRHASGTNLQQRQNLGRTRIWGIQNDVEYRLGIVLAILSRLSLQSGEGRRIRREPGARHQLSGPPGKRASSRRCPPIVGRCAWRTRIPIPDRRTRRAVHRPAVRRRSERARDSGARAGRRGLFRFHGPRITRLPA